MYIYIYETTSSNSTKLKMSAADRKNFLFEVSSYRKTTDMLRYKLEKLVIFLFFLWKMQNFFSEQKVSLNTLLSL